MKGLLRRAGLSLKGGSWGFHPATLNMAPGYTFKGKYNVEERHGKLRSFSYFQNGGAKYCNDRQL